MTTAIIGTGGIGSVIARQLAAGGETLRLSSADSASAHKLAAEIGPAAVVSVDNRDAVDTTLQRAVAAGGRADPNPAQDLGFLFNRHVEDPDGNVWEIMWMDPAALAQTAQVE